MSKEAARAALLGEKPPDAQAEPPAEERGRPASRTEARQRLLEAAESPAENLRELVRWKPHWMLLGAAAAGLVTAHSQDLQRVLVKTLLESVGVGKD